MELSVRITDDSFGLVKLAQAELGISQQEALSLFIECGTMLLLDGAGYINHEKIEIPEKTKIKLKHIRSIAGESKMDVFTDKLNSVWSAS